MERQRSSGRKGLFVLVDLSWMCGFVFERMLDVGTGAEDGVGAWWKVLVLVVVLKRRHCSADFVTQIAGYRG